MNSCPSSDEALQFRFRVLSHDEVALGPGKAQLLAEIATTGSIALAAKHLEMSYMRAWTLVKTMNRCFQEPVVAVTRGGVHRGGATLSPTGLRILELYRTMESQSRLAVADSWTELKSLLRKTPPGYLSEVEE